MENLYIKMYAGCGKCVKGCNTFGNGALFLQEAGLDGLYAVQPNCRGMDPRTLKAEYDFRLCNKVKQMLYGITILADSKAARYML